MDGGADGVAAGAAVVCGATRTAAAEVGGAIGEALVVPGDFVEGEEEIFVRFPLLAVAFFSFDMGSGEPMRYL